MERIVDYLAEELKKKEHQEARRKARKTGKHDRIKKMLNNIADTQTMPVIDMLAGVFGD